MRVYGVTEDETIVKDQLYEALHNTLDTIGNNRKVPLIDLNGRTDKITH